MGVIARLFYSLVFIIVVGIGIASAHFLAQNYALDGPKTAAGTLPTLDDSRQRCEPDSEGIPAFRINLERQLVMR